METLVFVAIASFILLAVTEAVIFFYNTNDYAVEQSAAIRNASDGVDSLVQDIREASFADNGAYPVASMSTSSMTVYADVNRDQRVEKVNYRLVDNNLQRTVTASTGTPPAYTGERSTSTISRNVRNKSQNQPLFTYYGTDGSKLSSLSARKDLAFVTIELIVNVAPDRKPENTTIRSSATLRNVNKPS